jgi:hypothetical protein
MTILNASVFSQLVLDRREICEKLSRQQHLKSGCPPSIK